MPNFHAIRDAWEEAFTTGKMGVGGVDYEQTLATLRTVSSGAHRPSMTEIEEDLFEAHYSEAGEFTVVRDDGDSKGGLDWARLPGGWRERQVAAVPAYELHHSIDLPRAPRSPHEAPLSLAALQEALCEAGFENGGLFMFKKAGVWAIRTSEFSNLGHAQCLARLLEQAARLRGITEALLRQERAAEAAKDEAGVGVAGGSGGGGGSNGLPLALPVFSTSCSLEKVHAIWRFD
jgi:hypothetical protein